MLMISGLFIDEDKTGPDEQIWVMMFNSLYVLGMHLCCLRVRLYYSETSRG